MTIELRYSQFLALTGNPIAAAILATASQEQNDTDPECRFLKPKDIAKSLSVSPTTVIGWIRSGQLKASNLAKAARPKYVIEKEALSEFLRMRRPEPPLTRRRRPSRFDSIQKRY